jgi:hypothetical protein
MVTVEWWLWNSGCGMVAVEWWLWNGGCGMVAVEWWLCQGGTGDCGLAADIDPPIPEGDLPPDRQMQSAT